MDRSPSPGPPPAWAARRRPFISFLDGVDRDDFGPDDPFARPEPFAVTGGDGFIERGVLGNDRGHRALASRVERVPLGVEGLYPLAVEDVFNPLLEPLHQADEPPGLGLTTGLRLGR